MNAQTKGGKHFPYYTHKTVWPLLVRLLKHEMRTKLNRIFLYYKDIAKVSILFKEIGVIALFMEM
jgi:hypothetical protein